MVGTDLREKAGKAVSGKARSLQDIHISNVQNAKFFFVV